MGRRRDGLSSSKSSIISSQLAGRCDAAGRVGRSTLRSSRKSSSVTLSRGRGRPSSRGRSLGGGLSRSHGGRGRSLEPSPRPDDGSMSGLRSSSPRSHGGSGAPGRPAGSPGGRSLLSCPPGRSCSHGGRAGPPVEPGSGDRSMMGGPLRGGRAPLGRFGSPTGGTCRSSRCVSSNSERTGRTSERPKESSPKSSSPKSSSSSSSSSSPKSSSATAHGGRGRARPEGGVSPSDFGCVEGGGISFARTFSVHAAPSHQRSLLGFCGSSYQPASATVAHLLSVHLLPFSCLFLSFSACRRSGATAAVVVT